MKYKRLTDKDIDIETRKKLCLVLCDIRRRCLNPDYKYFYLYGERGITVCDEWQGKEGQKNFREWAVNNGYKQGLSIDRIDNNKGYSPDNCRWATAKEQSYNRRSNKLITIHGKTQTVSEWADEIGISRGAMQNRLRYGWSEDRLLEPAYEPLKMSKGQMSDEIRRLRRFEKEINQKIEQGTLIELPCKVGDTVYKICPKCNSIHNGSCEHCAWRGCIAYDGCSVFGLWGDGQYPPEKCTIVPYTMDYRFIPVVLKNIGTKIFLTREEAEKRLEELQE